MQAEDIRPEHREKRDSPSTQSPTLFERLFSFFFGGNDPEREKKRLLKDIEHQLRSSKHRFYRPKSEEALPAMARYLHTLYTILGPAQLLVDHAESSEVLKAMVIEHAFSDRQRELHERLSEESITNRAAASSIDRLQMEVKGEVTELLSGFDAQSAKEIDDSFNLLSVFLDIIHFDYYFLLKKFDSHLPEHDFRYVPHFDTIQAEYVADDIKDLLSVIYAVDPRADWDAVLSVLRDYRGTEVVSGGDWHKVLRQIVDVRRSQVFELCIRHVSKDPYFKVKIVFPHATVVEDYLTKLKTRTELTVQKLVKQQREQTVEKYLMTVFGTTALARTMNYTEKNNDLFTPRMLGGFIHVVPINYLHAFLFDYFDRDVRELVDLLIVRGRWTTSLMSQQLSDSFHVLLQVCDEIIKFDLDLAEEAELGARIRGLVWKSDRDKTALKPLRELLKETNDQAMGMLQRSAHSFVVMAKSLKIVLEDYDTQERELLANWKEVEAASGGTIRSKIVEAYKKIYYFIQLLQLHVKKEPRR